MGARAYLLDCDLHRAGARLGRLHEVVQRLVRRVLADDDRVRLAGDTCHESQLVHAVAGQQLLERHRDDAVVGERGDGVAVGPRLHRLHDAGGADAALDVLDVDGPAQLLLGERADLADDPVGTATGTPGNDHPDVLGRIVLGDGAVGRDEAREQGGGSDRQQSGHGRPPGGFVTPGGCHARVRVHGMTSSYMMTDKRLPAVVTSRQRRAVANRLMWNGSIGVDVVPVAISSAMTSPTPGPSWKPWPQNPKA